MRDSRKMCLPSFIMSAMGFYSQTVFTTSVVPEDKFRAQWLQVGVSMMYMLTFSAYSCIQPLEFHIAIFFASHPFPQLELSYMCHDLHQILPLREAFRGPSTSTNGWTPWMKWSQTWKGNIYFIVSTIQVKGSCLCLPVCAEHFLPLRSVNKPCLKDQNLYF